jgi:hypothetical protein
MKFLLVQGGLIMESLETTALREEVLRIERVWEQNAEENIGPNGLDVAGYWRKLSNDMLNSL